MPIHTVMQKYSTSVSALGKLIADSAQVLHGTANDYDKLLDLIGDARFVLIGEASHGTHEFYAERARITQRLIEEKGFMAVAVEADWPDAYRVNHYVRQTPISKAEYKDGSAIDALSGFQRFPSWMWRNTDVAHFVDWLKMHNDESTEQQDKVGFYGLDLYSMFSSMEEVLKYLDKVDPDAAALARKRYSCFDHFNRDSQRYGYTTGLGLSVSCEDEVHQQLNELLDRKLQHIKSGDSADIDAQFYAQQNAKVVRNAEEYYRSMFRGRVSSWNLRDGHMAETLTALDKHLSEGAAKPAKIVVWAHNSHVGDARATEIGQQGELNLGQLIRQEYGDQCFLLGMTTYHGSVTASSDWDAPAEFKYVRPSVMDSYEEAMHAAEVPRFVLPLKFNGLLRTALSKSRLSRAIGVIYRPATERQSHYFYVNLPQQFDAILHIDKTRAVKPLDHLNVLISGEAPETYPVGI